MKDDRWNNLLTSLETMIRWSLLFYRKTNEASPSNHKVILARCYSSQRLTVLIVSSCDRVSRSNGTSSFRNFKTGTTPEQQKAQLSQTNECPYSRRIWKKLVEERSSELLELRQIRFWFQVPVGFH